jgi:hypothetical protein
MAFDTDFARQLTERFRDGTPEEKYKRKAVVSRREIVAGLYDDIMAQRSAGYSFEGIAAYFGSLGAPIKVSTLKSYLLRCAERPSPGQKAGAGQTRKRASATTTGTPRPQRSGVRRESAPARPPRTYSETTCATSMAQSTPAGADIIEETPPPEAKGRAADPTVSVAPARSEQTPSTTAEDVSALPHDSDAGTAPPAAAPTVAELGADAASERGTNPSAHAASPTTSEMAGELPASDVRALAPSPTPGASPSSSRVEPRTGAVGSGEKNPRPPTEGLVRADAPITAPARPEGLAKLLEGRASALERPRNAFTPRLDREL